MAYEYQWSLKTQPAIQKLLLKNSIKSIHPPYLLDSKYRYDFYLLSEISRLIKELRIEVFEEKYHLVSFSEMDKMDDQKILKGTSKNSRRIDFQRIMALKMLLI
jgi:hypothetical protein